MNKFLYLATADDVFLRTHKLEEAMFTKYREARHYLRTCYPNMMAQADAPSQSLGIVKYIVPTDYLEHLQFPLQGVELMEFKHKHKHRIDLSLKRRYII